MEKNLMRVIELAVAFLKAITYNNG